MIREAPDGTKWILQDKFLRITQNPTAPRYPKTGDVVKLKGHGLISDGEYVVEMVTEFEPGVDRDKNGQDIRISLLGIGKDFNGQNILVAMGKTSIPRICQSGWARPFKCFFGANNV